MTGQTGRLDGDIIVLRAGRRVQAPNEESVPNHTIIPSYHLNIKKSLRMRTKRLLVSTPLCWWSDDLLELAVSESADPFLL
jgi:hypothetical protein